MLKIALDSIIPQITNDVEIVVSDNASTDGTNELLEMYSKKYPYIKYKKHETNLGAERNIISVIENSNGEYCWLLGSDYALIMNSINIILSEIQSGYSIINCNRVWCDFNLNPIYVQSWLDPKIPTYTIRSQNQFELIDYYLHVISLGGLFSYISTLIFRRDLWLASDNKLSYEIEAYPHVYKMLHIMDNGGVLRYISAPLVFCRGDNDSYLQENGMGKRILIDIVGYIKLAELFYRNKPEIKAAFLRALRLQNNRSTIEMLKSNLFEEEWENKEITLIKAGYVPIYLNSDYYEWI